MNRTHLYISEVDRVASLSLPKVVRNRIKLALLDYICVALAGAKYNKDKLNQLIGIIGCENGYCKVLGFTKKTALKDAVFLNGLSAHSLDYDDGTNAGIIHLGAPIFSVLLSLAEKYDIDNEQFFRAAVAGYEASFLMAYSIQPKHKQLGYHATGTCGILGATLAICYAMGFDDKEKFNAFGTACVSASGMLKVLDDDSELKPYNVAKTALLALTSAEMAKAGFIGPDDPLGGERGYLAMMAGDSNIMIHEPMIDGRYAIEKAYVKPYAACRYCHPAIECGVRLRDKILKDYPVINWDDVEQIEVKTYLLAINGHDHRDVHSVSSAKMSIPYGVCVALVSGKAGLSEYSEEMITNSDIKELLKVTSVDEDELFTAEFPVKQSALVNIWIDGRTYSEKVDYPKGEPENPLSEDEFKTRFLEMCIYGGKEEEEANSVYEAVLDEKMRFKEIVGLI